MPFTSLGALLALLGVAAGAFGAHALRDRLDPAMLQTFETAARYQLVHALALFAAGATARHAPRSGVAFACTAFIAGVALFSGSLYALALTGVRTWGAVTPLGGVAFMAGWAALARAHWPKQAR